MRYLIFISLLLASFSAKAQSLEEELGYIYVKADYLLETNRYDEAIVELNKIIEKDPAYKDVLYKRAEAKFNVGAFAGTEKDLMESFEVVGITPEAVLLFGKAQKNNGEVAKSNVTLATAKILFPDGTSPREKSENTNDRTRGQEDNSSNDPLKNIEEKLSTILEDILPKREGQDTPSDTESRNDQSTDDRRDSMPSEGSTTNRTEEGKVEVEAPILVDEPDNSERELVIDEDVTLIFKNGIGKRKVLEQPNILILSESSGSVVIDLCIDKNGKVTQAEYNSNESSLRTQSIISLAVRKSKEFAFGSSASNEMCGSIVYKITGSN